MTNFPETGSASVEIAASTADVWALVTDITRMGEWSPECVRAEWNDGADAPGVGHAFTGHNRAGTFEWSVECEIVECDAERVFTFVAPRGGELLSTWRYEFAASADGRGCQVTESFHVPMINLEGAPSNFDGRHAMLMHGIETTLANLKAAAEA